MGDVFWACEVVFSFLFYKQFFFLISTWHKTAHKHALTSLHLAGKSLLGCRFYLRIKREIKIPLTKIPSINTGDCEQKWNILGGSVKHTRSFFVCLFVCFSNPDKTSPSLGRDWLTRTRSPLAVRTARRSVSVQVHRAALRFMQRHLSADKLCRAEKVPRVLEGCKNKKEQQKQRTLSNPLINLQPAAGEVVKARRKTIVRLKQRGLLWQEKTLHCWKHLDQRSEWRLDRLNKYVRSEPTDCQARDGLMFFF